VPFRTTFLATVLVEIGQNSFLLQPPVRLFTKLKLVLNEFAKSMFSTISIHRDFSI